MINEGDIIWSTTWWCTCTESLPFALEVREVDSWGKISLKCGGCSKHIGFILLDYLDDLDSWFYTSRDNALIGLFKQRAKNSS